MFQAMPFERPGEDLDASAGFTLIEALVALAVAAVSLAAIGLLMAGNIRGSGRIEQHLGLVETLRAVETGLPDRTSLSAGTLSGEMHGQAWSVDIAPFPGDFVNPRAAQVLDAPNDCHQGAIAVRSGASSSKPSALANGPARNETPARLHAPRSRPRESGFTLLEALIAVALMGVLLAMLCHGHRSLDGEAGGRASIAFRMPICWVSASTGSPPILRRPNMCRWGGGRAAFL